MAMKSVNVSLYPDEHLRVAQVDKSGAVRFFHFSPRSFAQRQSSWSSSYRQKVNASITPVFGLAVAFVILSVFLSICFGSDLSIVAFLQRLSNNSEALNSVKIVSLSEIINKLNTITLPPPSLDIPVIGAIVDTLTRAVNGLLSAFFGFLKIGVFLIEGVDDLIRIILVFLQSIV